MYKTVLVAVDFYDGSEEILERVSAIATAWNSDVYLLHMVENTYQAYGFMGAAIPYIEPEEIEKGSEERLKSLAVEHGLPAENVRVARGHVVRGILDIAKEIDVELIIIGSHGRHGIGVLLGSTANGVLHGADRDVLALRANT